MDEINREQTAVYLSSAYLAPIQYYTKLCRYGEVYVEQHDHYVKQTYRNRCTIAAADGPLNLTIPTEKSDKPKCPVKDIRISDHGKWRHLHWNAIESAYMNTPFFAYYQDDFRPFYERKWEFLYDYNEALCALICELLDIHPHIHRTQTYKNEFDAHEVDLRELVHPKHSITTLDPDFKARPYYQVFEARHGFLSNLSIVDLLFNMGPEGVLFLM